MKLHFAREALIDLDGIASDSRKLWGKRQTLRYLATINAVTKRLAQTPNQFPVVPERPTHRKARAGHHFVIFRIAQDARAVKVVRVLHERMDIEARLV